MMYDISVNARPTPKPLQPQSYPIKRIRVYASPVGAQRVSVRPHQRARRLPVPPKQKSYPTGKMNVLAPVLLLAVVIGVFMFQYGKPGDNQSAAAPVIQSEPKENTTVVAAEPKGPDEALMRQRIESIIGQYSGIDISISVTNLANSRKYNYGVDAGYMGASIGKLLTATLYLHEVERGNHSLDEKLYGQTARYQLEKLISDSDNTAWQALNDTLGKPALQSWADRNKLESYDAYTNIVSAPDTASLLTLLYQGKLLSNSNTKLMLSYMKKANYTQFIRSAVPEDITVYHKAGLLEDRVLDTAIIEMQDSPYVLVIFTKANPSYGPGGSVQIFHDITKATLEAFSQDDDPAVRG